MPLRTASQRARFWLAACICLLAAVVPPRGLAVCLGGGHGEGRASWAVADTSARCPCEADESRPGPGVDHGGGNGERGGEDHGEDHRDLEVPALAEATRFDSGSASVGEAFEHRALAAAACVDPCFDAPRARHAGPAPPPPRRCAQRSLRAVVLRI